MADKPEPILIDTDANAKASYRRNIDNLNESRRILSEGTDRYGQDLADLASKDLSKQVDNLAKTVNGLTDVFNKLSDNVKNNLSQQLREFGFSIKDGKINESLGKIRAESEKLTDKLSRLTKEGVADLDSALEIGTSAKEFEERLNLLSKFFEDFRDRNFSTNQDIDKSFKALSRILAEASSDISEVRQDLDRKSNELKTAKTIVDDAKNIQKQSLDQLSRDFNELRRTLDLSTLAKQFAPSSKAILQGDLQSTFNLTSGQFESFKKDLYDQIDTSLYTSEEIQQAMATLNTTALGNTQTATKYFGDIIRGQKVLGMSMETQQSLLKLGTVTGRNELAFYQGTVAKFLNSNLGLNKQQLNELVAMNANLQTQAADLGIATEAFAQTSMLESSALERTETGMGAKLNSVESYLLANTDTTASLLGMDSGQLAERLANGERITDLLRNSGAGAGQVIQAFQRGDQAEISRLREYASGAWGADNGDLWSVLRVLGTKGSDFDKNIATAVEASTQEATEAIKTVEDKQYDAMTKMNKGINYIRNQLDKLLNWKFMEYMTQIVALLSTAITIFKTGHDITGLLKNLTSAGGAASATGTGGIISAIGSIGGGPGSLGAALANGAGILGGVIATGAAIYDGIGVGFSGFKDAKGNRIGDTNGWKSGLAAAATNSDLNASKTKDWVSGALKGAGAGAAIGTLIGGPVGTFIGAGVGGLVGWGLGALGHQQKEEVRKQQEALDDIKENTATTAENTAKTANSLGMVYRYRGTSTAYIGDIGAPTGYPVHFGSSSSGAGIGMPDGIKVNSPYGARTPIKLNNGSYSSSFHNGVDLYATEGTPLYSNVNGMVSMNLTEKSGCNIVGVTDSMGYTHLYAHMQSKSPLAVGTPVTAGQFVGYAGKTGGVTGAHLHYSVVKPGKTSTYWKQDSVIDPMPFITSNIFSGDSSSIPLSAYSTTPLFDTQSSVSSALSSNAFKVMLDKAQGDVGPVVDSIHDLKNTIINLSTQVSRNQKIMNMLTSRAMESPTV